MTRLAKKNGRNPCRTQPGEIRRVRYHAIYSSANAAEFANVPKATVYHAMREGKLKAQTRVPGHPRIEHAELLRWMEERDFPIPKPLALRSPRDELLTLTGAARLARVSLDHVWEATEARQLAPAHEDDRKVWDWDSATPLPDRTEVRYRRGTVEAWRGRGTPIAHPQVRRLVWRSQVGDYMRKQGLTAALLAARTGNVLPRGIIQGMINGSAEFCTFENIIILASLLETETGVRPDPSQLLTFEPTQGHFWSGDGGRDTSADDIAQQMPVTIAEFLAEYNISEDAFVKQMVGTLPAAMARKLVGGVPAPDEWRERYGRGGSTVDRVVKGLTKLSGQPLVPEQFVELR